MQRPPHPLELQPQDLRRRTDPASLGFQTTRDLPAPEGMVGQDRALEAIDFALEIQESRYNLFVAARTRPRSASRRHATCLLRRGWLARIAPWRRLTSRWRSMRAAITYSSLGLPAAAGSRP